MQPTAHAVAAQHRELSFLAARVRAWRQRPLYVMRVEPLRETKFLYRGTIWIDSQDFAVTRIEAEPAKNPSFWTDALANPSSVPENRRVLPARAQPDRHRCAIRR